MRRSEHPLQVRRGRITAVLAALACPAFIWPAAASADPPADKIYGYEASFSNSRILEYTINQATSTAVFTRSCVPNPGSANGRGIALDERQGPDEPSQGGMNTETRVLYNTFLVGFSGTGFINRNRLPSHSPPCQPLAAIRFGEGPGPPNQDDIGALDFHDVDDFSRGKGQDTDVLYAAGYLATSPNGFGPGPSQILYKVNAENGQILGRCQAPTRTPGTGGNDTLTFARLKVGPNGQRKEVLLTDFGEFRLFNAPNSLAAVDEDSLLPVPAPAPAPPCRILREFPNPVANGGTGVVTGADFEKIEKPGDLEAAESLVVNGVNDPQSTNFYDANGPPFAVGRLMGSTAPSFIVEDNTVGRVNPPEE